MVVWMVEALHSGVAPEVWLVNWTPPQSKTATPRHQLPLPAILVVWLVSPRTHPISLTVTCAGPVTSSLNIITPQGLLAMSLGQEANKAVVNNSFWDMEATGANDSVGGIWATHCPDEVSGYLRRCWLGF